MAWYSKWLILLSTMVSALQCCAATIESSRYTVVDTQRSGVTCVIRQFAKHEKEWLLFAQDYIKVIKYSGPGIVIPSFFTSEYQYYNCIEVIIKNNTTAQIVLPRNKYLLRYANHTVDWDEVLVHYASGAALWSSPNSLLYLMGGLMGFISGVAALSWYGLKEKPLARCIFACNLFPLGAAIFGAVMKKRLATCLQKYTKLKSLRPSIKNVENKKISLEKSDFYTVMPGETFMDLLLLYQPPLANNRSLDNQISPCQTFSF